MKIPYARPAQEVIVIDFLRHHVYFVYEHLQTLYSLFAYILLGFCVLLVFFPLFFYIENINFLHRFHVVLRVYFTNIPSTFYRHDKGYVCVHFIDILCSYFGSLFTEMLFTFYLTYFTGIFFLEYFTKIIFTF